MDWASDLLPLARVGVAVSSGHAALDLGVTVLALVTLRGVRWVEERIRRRRGGAPNPDAS